MRRQDAYKAAKGLEQLKENGTLSPEGALTLQKLVVGQWLGEELDQMMGRFLFITEPSLHGDLARAETALNELVALDILGRQDADALLAFLVRGAPPAKSRKRKTSFWSRLGF